MAAMPKEVVVLLRVEGSEEALAKIQAVRDALLALREAVALMRIDAVEREAE